MALRLSTFPVIPTIDEIRFIDSFNYGRGDRDPVTGEYEYTHGATDIMGQRGEVVVSTVAGYVAAEVNLRGRVLPGASHSENGGFFVMIVEGAGNFHYFAHLMCRPFVMPRSYVRAGDFIGLLGDTGIARGCPHLHYQIWAANIDAEATNEYIYGVFPRRLRTPVNPYHELARLAALEYGVSPDPRSGRFHIPPNSRLTRC